MEEERKWFEGVDQKVSLLEKRGLEYALDPERFLNDICWCGSFRKYRDCHYSLTSLVPMTPEEVWQLRKSCYKHTSECLLTGCNCFSIKSHSLPKSWLKNIANAKNEAYHFEYDFWESLKKHRDNFVGNPISITKTSTFRGFCAKHDMELFKEIETSKIFKISSRNIMLLYYRCICFEIYYKSRAIEVAKEVRRIGCNGLDHLSQVNDFSHYTQHIIGSEKALQELEELKANCELLLSNSDFLSLKYMYIPLKNTELPFMETGIHKPLFSFNGDYIQNLREDDQFEVVCMISQSGNKKFVIFVSLNRNTSKNDIFYRGLLTCNNLGERVTSYVLESSENIFWRIDHWDKLGKNKKEKIFQTIENSLLVDPISYYSKTVASFGCNLEIDYPNIVKKI